MGIGLIVVLLFGGSQFFILLQDGIIYAVTQETVFAALAFVFMAYVMTKTGLISRLVDILNSILGRIPGGAGYISTLASALMGMISGSGSGNAASVGSITIPWMINSNWPRELSATVVAGNAGLGASIPPCSAMFILLGMAVVADKVTTGQLYMALLTAGLWVTLYRLVVVRFFVKQYDIKPLPAEMIKPFSQTLRDGWSSLLMFLGIIIPIVVTMGPIAEALSAAKNFGAEALDEISIIVWIPVLISWIALFEGRKYLPKTAAGWYDFIVSSSKRYVVVGATLVFAFAAGRVLTKLGLSEDIMAILEAVNLSPLLIVILVGILVIAVAAPLTNTATITAVGSVSFSALLMAGINPVAAATAILIWSASEGASPPNSAPIFIATGIANVDPVKTFKPLIIYYLIPTIILGTLIALQILPIYII
ncbi:C4-dicarboxylate ABC transporter permease [Thermoanaerobacteraceae bacterium SP2]|nr:C4-dicarboxylate ABC transporter permease [Thermoanaerobacteraceae bacterium SP2]